jgi:hypothetical protein
VDVWPRLFPRKEIESIPFPAEDGRAHESRLRHLHRTSKPQQEGDELREPV